MVPLSKRRDGGSAVARINGEPWTSARRNEPAAGQGRHCWTRPPRTACASPQSNRAARARRVFVMPSPLIFGYPNNSRKRGDLAVV
jgi:hypothetical protein